MNVLETRDALILVDRLADKLNHKKRQYALTCNSKELESTINETLKEQWFVKLVIPKDLCDANGFKTFLVVFEK